MESIENPKCEYCGTTLTDREFKLIAEDSIHKIEFLRKNPGMVEMMCDKCAGEPMKEADEEKFFDFEDEDESE